MNSVKNGQTQPVVSVIIPTYNHAHFLGKALRSVQEQTYPYWEALIIDNHSQDNTVEVVKSFNDPRMRLFQIRNKGVIAVSRNLGMRESKGEWIAFLDSDDYWYPRKLEIIMDTVQAEEAYDVLSNDELMVDIKTGSKTVLRYGPYQEDFYKRLLLVGNCLSPSATVIRRSFLRKYDHCFRESSDFITVEDYDFWLNLARTGARFKFIHGIQGEYVIHGANTSAQRSRHRSNLESMLHDHVYNIQRFHPSPDRLWKHVHSRLHLEQAWYYAGNRQPGKAIKKLSEALIKFPMNTSMHLLSRLKSTLRHHLRSKINRCSIS